MGRERFMKNAIVNFLLALAIGGGIVAVITLPIFLFLLAIS